MNTNKNAWHYLHRHSWHPGRRTLRGGALRSKDVFVSSMRKGLLRVYLLAYLCFVSLDNRWHSCSFPPPPPKASWFLLAHKQTSANTRCTSHFLFSFKHTLKSNHLKQVCTRDGFTKATSDDRSKATSARHPATVCFVSEACHLASPYRSRLPVRASAFPIRARTGNRTPAFRGKQKKKKKTISFSTTWSRLKSWCFLFLFLPIMPSTMSPMNVLIWVSVTISCTGLKSLFWFGVM